MEWTTPEITEIRMDAEIGSYQADDAVDRVPPATGAPDGRPEIETEE